MINSSPPPRHVERRREPRSKRPVGLLSESVEMPSFSAAKDTRGHSVFRSATARILWRLLTWRLTSAGRWMLIPTIFLFAYASTSLTLQAFIPFCYFAALWILALAAPIFFRPRVKMSARHPQNVFAGQIMQVEVEIQQLGWIGGYDLHVLPHGLPASIDPLEPDGVPLPGLRKGDKTRAILKLICNHRGSFSMNGFRAETDFPFGLWRSYKVYERQKHLIVYPRFEPLAQLVIPPSRRYQPGGVALASTVGESVEFVGNREYRSGDNIRDIDWRATARWNKPIVREYREEYLLRVAVVLDTQLEANASPVLRQAFEAAISACAAAGDWLARMEYVVDILAAGPDLYRLQAGRHLAFIEQILDILACVEPGAKDGFDGIEPALRENISSIGCVICIFLDWNESRRAFAYALREMGAAIKVLVVRDGSCTLDPFQDEARLGSVLVVSPAQVNAGLGEF